MALVATYGDTNAYNIKLYDMAGGGYYAILCDATTEIFKRRNAAGTQDIALWNGASHVNVLDHFTSYSYDTATSTLTLSGAADTYNGVTYTRQETYRFVSAYIVHDTWTVTANADGEISGSNWNYYTGAINAVIDTDTTNAGNVTSTMPLGLGIQLTIGGSFYGVLADNQYTNLNTNYKQSLASVSGITVIRPDNTNHMPLNATNNRTYTMSQFFFKSTNTLKDFMYQAQLAVAQTKGFTGTTWETICKVTSYLNISVYDNLTDIKIIPAPYYPISMFMRDGWWQSLNISDTQEQACMDKFEEKIQADGQIPTWIRGNETVQLFQDESNLLYIIRAYYDRFYRNLSINQATITAAFNHLQTFVTNYQYRTDSTDSARGKTWNDSFYFTADTYNGYGQGLYCVALKCAQNLGLSVTSTDINGAIDQYQALYDTTNKFIKFASDKTYISPDVLVGEALSLWLFGEKMLNYTHVSNTIKAIRKTKTAAGCKVISDSTGAYISGTNFTGAFTGGDYQNGGSWFLYEYLAYYAAFYHGVTDARAYMEDRKNIELGQEAVSHEYLVSSPSVANYLSEPPERHVYSWNTASLVIKPSARQPVV